MAKHMTMEAQFPLVMLGKAAVPCFVILADLTAAVEEIDTENSTILMEAKWASRMKMDLCTETEGHK